MLDKHKKAELERLLSRALLVYVRDDRPISDAGIQASALGLLNFLQSAGKTVQLDDVLPYTEKIAGFNYNEVYVFFVNPADEKQFQQLYNEIYAQPAINDLLKPRKDGLIFEWDAKSPRSYALKCPTLNLRDFGSIGATRSDNQVPLSDVVAEMAEAGYHTAMDDPEEQEDPAENIDRLGSYVRITNGAGNHTEADAFFGEYGHLAKKAYKVNGQTSWISSLVKPIEDFRARGPDIA